MKHFILPGLLGLTILASLNMACNGTKAAGTDLLPASDDPAIITAQYNDSRELWTKNGPKKYLLRLTYGAFSPQHGNWEITVCDGLVTNRRHKSVQVAAENRAMNTMTMERLFEIAAPATNARHNGPFRIQARFRVDGSVASISRIRNTNWQAATPRDMTFAYSVDPVQPLD